MLNFVDKIAGAWLDWRLARRVNTDPKMTELNLKKVEVDDDGIMRVIASSPIITVFAEQCTRLLDEANVENYVSFDMAPRTDLSKRPLRVTVQWANGISPAEKSIKLEQQIGVLKAELARLCETHGDHLSYSVRVQFGDICLGTKFLYYDGRILCKILPHCAIELGLFDNAEAELMVGHETVMVCPADAPSGNSD